MYVYVSNYGKCSTPLLFYAGAHRAYGIYCALQDDSIIVIIIIIIINLSTEQLQRVRHLHLCMVGRALRHLERAPSIYTLYRSIISCHFYIYLVDASGSAHCNFHRLRLCEWFFCYCKGYYTQQQCP